MTTGVISLSAETVNGHFLSKSSEEMAALGILRVTGPKKPYSPSTSRSQVSAAMIHPEQIKQDPGGGVANVVHRVTSWNENPDKLQHEERLNYLEKTKQIVAQASMNPHEWPTSYLSQPALLRFLRLVVDSCMQHSSTQSMPTAEIRVAVKKVVEPIDLDAVEDLPFRRHISKWVYGTETLPLLMDCENILSLCTYFKYALDHMHAPFKKGDLLSVVQPDVTTSVTTALANIICCFTNHLKKTGQRYEETLVMTMLLPFNYDPDQQAFLTSISVREVEYFCNKFGYQCKEFFEVIKQNNVKKTQAYLIMLALKMHKDLHLPNSQMRSYLKCIEQMIGKDIDPQIAEILLQQHSPDCDWALLQSQLRSISSITEKKKCSPVNPSKKQQCDTFFSILGLTDFYPQRLTLHHALEIRKDTLESVKHLQDSGSFTADKRQTRKVQKPVPCTDPILYPFLILQKIMAFDNTCRTKLVLSSKLHSDSIRILPRKGIGKNVTDHVVHPMDGLLAILHCADNFLRQDLMSRLTTCQLSIPLLLPDPIEPHTVTFPLWAMRSIVKEWHTSNGTSKECQIVSYPFPLVSFLRIGKFKVSKSHTINYTISESGHNFFFQYNCSGGGATHLLVNGLVEMCWYLPSKRDMVFPDLIAFTNLHGDAREYHKQVQFLSKVSFMNFVLINEDNRNDEALKVLEALATAPGGLVLLSVGLSEDDDMWQEWLEPIKQSVQVISLEEKTEADIREEIREEINCKLDEKWTNADNWSSLEKHSDTARLCNIFVDEDEEHCQRGKELAVAFERITNSLRRTHRVKSLRKSLPLQGPELWQKWGLTEKEQYRQTQRERCEVDVYCQKQRKKMENIRREQFNHIQHLKPLMESFLTPLLTHKGKTRHYFLLWIQLFLDNLSREQLPQLHTKYKDKVIELEHIRKRNNEAAEKACMTEIKELNMQLRDTSFGLEHLLREVSQIYEAVAAQKQELVFQRNRHILHLPEVAAELMIEGHPLELMDGDAAHVPISWVSAVLSKLQELLENPRLFVLSVLGIQSSGKSTLMNTVFGVRFTTSAGRCTRGAFMQLIPIHSSLRHECKCDYFLIVDTEGLRAPELAEQTHRHDNELATFVIGLANLTIINLSGETAGDMDDILQTTIHAFLRMKRVELKPSCYFIHQNVTAVKAGEKTMMGHLKFKETLDMNTQAAAKEEGLEGKRYFTDIINFDSEKHVFHFQNLWKGDPPMAPVNPGYSTNAQFLKLCLITHANVTDSIQLKVFEKHLRELWKAILHENFVFSFKNTLEITAYNTLERAYSKWSWEFKQQMMTWEHKASNMMKSCTAVMLPSVYRKCCSELRNYVQDIYKRLEERMNIFFEDSPQQEIIIKWKGETETRLNILMRQLQEHAESHCKLFKANQDTLAKVDKMNEEYTTMILSSVHRVATQLEKGKLNDKQLEERFSVIWKQCIEGIKHLPVHKEEVNVETDVEYCLTHFEALRRALPTVFEKLRSNPLWKRGHHLQLTVTNWHIKARPVYRFKIRWGSEFPIKKSQDITNVILEYQRQYIQQMKQKHYNPNLATDLLHKLFNEISSHSRDVCFTEEYKIDMALTVCGYAVTKFQEMVDTERKQNDPVEHLERKMKGPLLKIFKDEYYEIEREITAASGICDLLLHSVRKEVFASLSRRIADGMKGFYDFLQSKPTLKAKILLDIGDRLHERHGQSFADCLLYLKDVEKSLRCWLEHYTIQYCEVKFTGIASKEVTENVKQIREEIDTVSEKFSQTKSDFKIIEWLTIFHNGIQTNGHLHLDVTELLQLGGVHQLKDVSRFTEEVLKGLNKLEFTLKKEFDSMPLTEMDNWMKKKPHDYLFEDLAGCTEQCPFCKEQCDLTTPNHSTKHSVAMHRPQCLGGYRNSKSEEMVLDVCPSDVGSNKTFKNCDTESEVHPYKEYATFYPQWSIPADLSLETSLYWKWLVGHYDHEIAEAFEMKQIAIPTEWRRLQWSDVKENLKDTYNI